jgi:hypothetical protein
LKKFCGNFLQQYILKSFWIVAARPESFLGKGFFKNIVENFFTGRETFFPNNFGAARVGECVALWFWESGLGQWVITGGSKTRAVSNRNPNHIKTRAWLRANVLFSGFVCQEEGFSRMIVDGRPP